MKYLILCSFIAFFLHINNSFCQLVFPENYKLSGTEVLKDQYYTHKLFSIDTLLIAQEREENGYYFSVFNSKDLKKVGQLAKVGYGPDEFNSGLSYYGQYELINDSIFIWLKGVNSHILYKINLSQSLIEDKTIIADEIQLLPQSEFYACFYIDSAHIIGRSANTNLHMNRLQIYNPISNSIAKTIRPFPEFKNNNTGDITYTQYRYNTLYISMININSDKTKVTSAMNMFNRIDIFSVDGEKIKSIIEDDGNSNSVINEYLEASDSKLEKVPVKFYYTGVYTNNKYIYALFRDQLFSEYGQVFKETVIRVFDWNGNPQFTITVPDYLYSFTIDEKEGYLYGVALFNEKILKYDIQKILEKH